LEGRVALYDLESLPDQRHKLRERCRPQQQSLAQDRALRPQQLRRCNHGQADQGLAQGLAQGLDLVPDLVPDPGQAVLRPSFQGQDPDRDQGQDHGLEPVVEALEVAPEFLGASLLQTCRL